LINNRQAGRRRGRNNPRQNGGGNRGGGDSGNRIDSRARGNAAQLLEKYRNMARDAQMAGDRVNAEYYLQFADHYFRVLADNRARQEEQQQRFRRHDEAEPDSGDEGFDPVEIAGGDEAEEPAPRRERAERRERPERRPRAERDQTIANDDEDGEEGDISLPGLPPSIARIEPVEDEPAEEEAVTVEEQPAKRRRGRRPRQPEAAE